MQENLGRTPATTSLSWPEKLVTEAKPFRQLIDRGTVKILRWGQKLPVGLRSIVGLLLMLGGVFGFLPIIGFWMFPLGLALIALDIPWTRSRIQQWIQHTETRVRTTATQRPANNHPNHDA